MQLNSRIVRGALLAVTVAISVSAVPVAGGAADAKGPGQNAILKNSAILKGNAIL